MQTPETRALQHLLFQDFTLMPFSAAVCTRLVEPSLMENTSWAVICTSGSVAWASRLDTDTSEISTILKQAAQMTVDGPQVVCHAEGGILIVPLTVTDVRDARIRIKAALAVGQPTPVDNLAAFPDELIEREANRRKAIKDKAEVVVVDSLPGRVGQNK